ncbi:DUF3383 domain-containing protein [Xanthobacter agilis]|uniref:DUF3383 domain-containing protein n=1 Tax=Xanthobacter agilis TaxID=47492 RepID=A0ABU0LJU6_XANAG|nr:DUF3383 domain-containing protein [Xanthobacter agilis]MDQ0507409.1 hypothetical protein [Xanthobacter agilis]
MAQGLAVSDVVNVTVTISPTAATTRNFGAGLLISTRDVVDVGERIRSYSSLEGVGGDFGSTDSEYLAASKFFSQSPQPSLVYIGRWAKGPTPGTLKGGVLSTSERRMSEWTGITDGSFTISINGTAKNVTGLNFSAASNLPAVAAIIDAGLTGASVTWDANANRFVVKSDTTGTSSTVTYATNYSTGTSVATALKFTSSTASAPVDGIAAESLSDAIEAFVDTSGDWYAGILVQNTDDNLDDFFAAAQIVEGLGKARMLGGTVTSSTVLDSTNTEDLASLCSDAGLSHTFLQYSSQPYAAASFFGRAATVDFTGSDTTLTMKFKTEPGMTAETLTETQASTLKAKHCNVFVNYDNSTAIIQEGVMSNGYFFDEVHGLDWLKDYIQTDVWNLLYTSTTKVPQTNAGNSLIATRIEKCLQQAVKNGLVAPGTWNAAGFGTLKQGDYLETGYYVYQPDISEQAQADREARKSVSFQVAVKLAGAIHSVVIAVNVNR